MHKTALVTRVPIARLALRPDTWNRVAREMAMGVIKNYTSVPHVLSSAEVTLFQAIANQVAIVN
jgi:hypothetical protein